MTTTSEPGIRTVDDFLPCVQAMIAETQADAAFANTEYEKASDHEAQLGWAAKLHECSVRLRTLYEVQTFMLHPGPCPAHHGD